MASMPRDIDLASDNLAQIWDWNAQVPESVVVGVHSMFERCAQHQPTALAVDAWDGKLTYGELNRLSSNLAAYLIREGVGQGKTVPLCFEKSMWTTVAMLAVLKADSSFVLLEPSLPEGRLQIVIEQTNADIVVCSLATGDLSRRLVNRVLCLDSPLCTKLASAVPSGNLGSLVTFEPSSPMYIVYTSGSTGSPKGVIVSHQAHASALHHQTQQLGITAESRIFEFSAYSFDIAIYNTFSALTRGGCLCVPREQDRRNSLAQAITMSSANFVYLTPTVARQISPDSAPTLETVAFIGEALSPRDLEPWQNKVRFVNTYGPSECTTASTINPSTTDIEKSCLIGKGSGMVTWIVDPEDHNVLLPLGAVGELLLEGPLLANGYLGDEAKTSKAFLHDPEWLLKGSCRVPGRRGRLYKTGDLVRYHGHGGDLHFVGRKDNQVKIRGNRVELGEVEYRIAEILSLSSKVVADVITPRGKNSSPILAVFLENDQDVITGSAIVMPVPQDLISNLSNYLPSYMIPNVFFSVNKLPMTSSGKTDRRALREIGQSFSAREIAMAQAASQTVRRSPDSELSRKMQQLWSKVLDLEPDLIGLDDSFLQLGGDSVRAMNLVTVSRAAGLQLTVADIFQRPTLQDVTKSANIIDEEAQRASAQRIEPFSLLGQGLDVESFLQDVAEEYQVDSSIILDAFPCTPLQEGLLSLSSMSSGEYVSQNVLELDAQVDIDKFCAAWEQVCVVVDALRTRIVHHRHLGLVQLVMRETIHWFQGTDIKEYLTSDQEQVMGPGSQLSRFALIGDATNGKRYFIWTIHHALYDEWSLSLLLSLASKIYSGSTIAPIPTFQPFIKYIQDQDPSRAALYWEEALNGCECAPFPTLPPSISQPLVDTSVVHQLPHVHRANASGITTATVIRASWALVVASMTNSDDVVFGGTVSGRNVPIADIETVPAPTIATVPVRITLGGSEQLVSELLQTVQSQAIDMVPYEQMGLHRIAKISLDAQQACDFQTLIVIQPEDGRRSKTTFGSWREDLKQQELSTYGLTLEVHLGTDNTTVKASFDSRMIQPWIVDGLLERLAHVMNQLDDIGEKSILADIQVITQEDLSRIWTWNRSVPKTANVSIHEILSHKASTRPTHTAISAWDGEFSYQEMDRLTTVLAARIYELGLAQGSIIPLYFEKSAWANVAMLAVLKAGCAFVLLDTSLPEQRLVEMIRQVSAEFILCSPSTRNTSLRLASRVLEVDEALLSELTRASLTNGSVSLPLVSPDSLAYVLFTSGSTGRPKCVAITHNNVTSAVPEHVERLGYTEETRIYDFASYSFGASLNNAFCALVAGGCLCVPSDEDRRSNLAESLSALKATSVLLTPSIAESLSPESVTSLKTLILGGEAVRPKHVKPWWDRARVLTAYGSSEMTTVATINSQASDPDEVTRIGTGAGGVTWVVDPDNHHVLSVPGSIGELLLEGPLVGSGYLHEPTKTSEVFIEDPKWLLEGSCTVPGRRGRLYKTGDLVRYNQDGSLSYIGRNDQQVKIRGQRVELGEIEFRVHQCFPAAKFVASEVIFPQAHEGNPMIAAFLQMDAGDGANAENEEEDGATILAVSSTVENWLAEQLPIYMVPAVFFALRKLPLLSTGKMNRRMLRAIGNSVSMAEITEVKDGQKVAKRQPGSELEGQIQALWARTLNMEQENIGMDDSFFRLGGDSISAMQVVSGARSKMISLRVVDILRLKTISNLAKSVEAAKNSYTVGRVPEGSTGPTRPRRNKAPSQLSPIQNLYFHLQQDATACFDQYFFLKLNWHVEYEDVVTAISSVIRRHDALRTRFSKNETGTWEQSIIHDDGASSLRLLLETENDASRRATIISDVRSGLDIVNGPIVSGVLFDQGQQALFLTIHHLVIDLVSWRIILQELEDLLTHGVAGIASPSLHFPDWIAMQARYAREHLDPGSFDSQNSQINASYWGMETNANLRSGAAVLEFTLDEHTSSRILGSCNAPLGTQPLEIMISALIHSFSRIFGDRPLPLVFTEGHGREVWDDDIDLSTTVGWFSTIYPVHDLADARNMGIIDIIRHTKDFIRRMPQNGWSHFTSRFADYKLASDFSKDFPVEILFNYIGLYQQLERGDGLFQMANVPAGSHPPSNERVRRFTLFDIDVYVDKGHIHATLESHQDMCHQEKIVKWVAQFEASLRLFATELPGVPSQLTLSDIPMAFTSHHDLQEFYEMSLPQLQLETDDIEHIFPCAPLQEGILLSQAKDPLSYQRWFDVQIDAHDGGPPLTRSEIERAWKAVVKRHGLLRALLVGNIPGSVGTMHVILKDPTPEIIWLNNGDEWKMRSLSGDRLQHRATIIEFSENKVLLRVQMNHAITDGFSQDMLCRDLRNALLGQNSAVSSSYERFIRHLSSQSPTDGLEYWKEQLSNIEPCLLPSSEVVDHAADGVGISSLHVSGLDTERIRTFCSEWDVTPATIVKVAWGLVLSLYTDTSVPAFGNLYSGRDIPMHGVDDMFGPLIGMVPCFVRIDQDKTVIETLKQVQSDYLCGLEYQHASLAEIHRALDLGSSTLFNTLLSYQRQTEEDQIQTNGVTVRAVDNFDPTEYDVTVDIVDAIAKIDIELTFRSGHLSNADQQCLVGCVGATILSILDGPLKAIGQLSLIGKADLGKIWAWNQHLPLADNKFIHDMFEEHAYSQPDALAIHAWDGDMSYRRLSKLSAALASQLRQLGIGHNDLVPVCFEKSMWASVAMLAVLKAGAAFVLLDSTLPESRLRCMVEQVNTDVIISSTSNAQLSARLSKNVMAVGASLVDELTTHAPDPPSPSQAQPNSTTMFAVFTSGSTGTPKGVLLTHTNFATALKHQAGLLGFKKESRIFDFASYAFDMAVHNAFGALGTGACLCVPSEEGRRGNLVATMRSMKVTVADVTSSVARLIDPDSLPDLETIILGGEALSVDDVNRWWGKARVVNIYGPAETHITTVNADAPTPELATRLGRGIGLATWIVDPNNHNRLLPPGCVGELLLEGPLVGKGYLNDPKRTETSFVNDPAWLIRGAPGHRGRRGRLYKSGDLVRYDAEGRLAYVSRKDNQVKLRGQRIELGEIEHQVQECVTEATQVVSEIIAPSGANTKSVVAVFIQFGQDGSGSSTTADILSVDPETVANISRRLPRYMVPSVFFRIRSFQKTPSGKINRILLRQIGASFSAQQLAESASLSLGPIRNPVTHVEHRMQGIWARVLNIDPSIISLDGDFFQLGGDSIAAMKLVAEARKVGIGLTVADVFRHPTLEHSAAHAVLGAGSKHLDTILPFTLLGDQAQAQELLQDVAFRLNMDISRIHDAYPATPLQQGLFSLSLKRSGDYVMQSILELYPETDIDKFQQAWQKVAETFPILRTRMMQSDDHGLLQIVCDDPPQWNKVIGLDEYLKADRAESMGLGEPLTRYALVQDMATPSKMWFIWTVHHVLYDGWSEPLITSAVNQAYQGITTDSGPQFRTFIKYVKEQDGNRSRQYWESALADCEAVTFPALPPSIKEPMADSFVEHLLPRPHGSHHGATISTLIRAAWGLVACGMTNAEDVVFGATVSGRNAPVDGIGEIVGPTFATVPIRVKLAAAGETVGSYLDKVQQQATDMIPYEQMGLHHIAKISTSTQRACGFQTLLVIQPQSDSGNDAKVLGKLREGNQHQWFNTFGLTLVAEIGISIKVKASFDSRVIEPWVVRNLLQQLAVVMEQLDGCEAGRSLKTVSRVSYQDLSTMWEWNKTPTKPANKSISELIRDQSRAQPDSIAVDAWDGSLTYHHLDQLSTNMACYLVKRGLRRGDFVLICTEKSKWATVSILALAKTEAAFVLLDPSLPLQRLKSISRQVQAKLAISSLQYKTLSLQLCQDVLTVSSSLFVKLPTESCEDLPTLDLDSAIYVVFTSGTTGTPKGAVIHHRSSATAVMNQVKGFGYNTETRLYDFSTYSFDGSILNAFTVLYGGGTLCVPTDDGRKSSLAESMESLKANTVFLTPSVANIMSPREVPHLKTMILGGEAIRVEDVQPWWDFVKVFTIYGPSECTPVSLINPSPSTPEEALRLGWGAGQTSWVVDSENHDVLAPLGCVGELLLEGPLVGAGYFQEPEKTASAFITDPEWLIKGYGHLTGRRGRLYKTGDLVRYNMDGSLSYVSRKDDQVKIHGSRVELGEVEHQVRNCVPLSTQVVAEVITPSSKRSEPILAAFVQVADEADPTSACRVLPNTPDIQHQLSQLLPAYMIPSVVFAMKQLPMGTTGKMNRKELRKIGSAFTAQDLAKLKANTEIEKRDATTPQQKKIQEIWARVLGVDARMVGIDDSFFQLGGDSITAMRFVGEMRKAGLQLTVADVFRSPQLYKLANQATTGGTDIKTIKPTKLQGPVEQSFAQGRLWFLEQLYPGLTWYLMPCIMSLRGPLHLEALNVAFRALEQRHETLRTTLSTKNGVNLQHIHPVRGCDLRIVALSPDDEKTIADHLHRDETTPFDLSKEPGWRVTLYKLGENHHILSIILHHIFSDGWSVDIFRREMAEFYSAAMAGKDPLSLATPLPVQYRDFSLFQREQTQLEHHDRQLEYWVRQLENSQPAELPCDKHRPSTLSGIADLQTFRIQGSLYKSLQAFCKKHEVTPFIALLTAFRATHYRLTGESDVLIGSPNANRDSADLKDVIGFFVNMQCLRLVVEDETVSFLDLMKRTQSAVTASFQNQDVPFESLVSRLRKERDLSRHPLVQIVFALHSQRDLGKFTLEGLDAEYIDQSITTRFDLEFHFFHEEDGLRGDLIYSTDLFQPVTMKNTLTIFTKLLEGSLENPETPVALLSLMTEGGLAQMNKLDMLEIQKTDYPRDSTIVTEFRKQVLKCSDKVAVKDLSMQLTYRELDDKSDKLANWLQNRRYAPESLVGVLVDRSCFAVVAFIGILKANLAYLPFDLKTPTNRMRSMLLSVPGHKLILVGPGAKLPAIDLPDVEHMGIVEALEQAQQIDTAMDVNCTPNHRQPSSSSLAYVMFTSGSTGNPKGVLVEHGNILRLCKENAVNGFDTTGIIASMSNVAFDAVTWEVYTALLNGGTLVCLDYFTVLDFDAVGRIFRQEDIRAIFITPALLKQYLSRCPSAIASLELLFIGGDKLDPKDILVARDLLGQNGKITAVYGPTENTGFSTFYPLPNEDECVNGVSIGRSISNSGAYVMDSQQQLVPIGVVGELIVTGDGVARGYTDAARTAERFIEVEVNGKQVKAYRTGDYVRARPTDGQLDYIRRMDGQVKIRGQRLELGEVEHVLKSHASVNDAAVILHQPKDEQAQLISFATLDEKKIQTQITDLELPPGTDDERQPGDDSDVEKQVKVWEESFETDIYETIGDLRPEQVGRDFVGWISMYDGAEIDKGEMNEWLDDTIATMINGGESGHVLELGSGTGMILFNLINTGLRSYVGLDPSQKAVDFVARSAMKSPELASKVHMYKGTAADLSHLDEPICPDLVVVNSVAQYFPGQQYTLNVIKDILALKGSGAKTMFFGDMRSYALYDQFRVTRALHRVGRKPGKNEVRQQMKDMEEMEVEYLVAPAFFTSLPTLLPDLVEHVEILPKKMKGTNELSCYRYAAVVHARHTGKSLSIHQVHPSSWVDFQKEELDAMSLFEHLRRATASSVVAVGNIPYSKTIFERQVLSSLRCEDEGSANTGHWLLEARQKSEKCPSLDAISLTKIAERAGWQVEISWARQYSQQGGLDAIFHRKQPANMGHARVLFQFPTDHDDLPVGTQLSSQPLRQQVKQRIRAQLHDRLQTSLPPYMIPRVINFLDRLPINENGKVDRRALAQSVQARTATRSSLVRQPVSDNERRLQKIWAQVLNIEQHTIGLDDSFFQVGGDSLAAMKLVGEARRSGISINVADIFRRPTLQEMSCFETGSAAQGPSASIPRVETSGPVEQSFAQGRLWFMEQLYPGLTWYLMPFAIRINGDVSVPALLTALHALELRHDTLRTTFASRQDVNIQEVHRFQPKELKIVDVADEQELSDALRQDQTTPIRLGVEAGWRVRLLRLDPTRHILSIVMHHIISDGWSTDVLQKELSAFYSAALKAWSSELDSDKVLTSTVCALPPLPIQYTDFSIWQRQPEQLAEHRKQLEYWVGQLETSQPAELLCDKPRPKTLSGAAAVASLTIDGALYGQLEQFCNVNGVTKFVALLAAFRITHLHLTGSVDASIGTVNANRARSEVKDMIGFFVNMQCLRIPIQDESFSELVKQVHKITVDSLSAQDVPFENLVSSLQRDRDLSRHPLVQLVFAFHSQMDLGDFTLEGLETETIAVPPTTRFDLEFHLFQQHDSLQGEVLYSTDLFDETTMKNMLSVFRTVLETGLQDPTLPVTSLPLLSDEDFRVLDDMKLIEMDRIDYPRDDDLASLFRRQAAITPKNIAVKDPAGQLTYSELDQKSDSLASWLVQQDLAPETLVGIFSARSCKTIIAMLGIVKAGLAYLPFDLKIPKARMETILSSIEGQKIILYGSNVEQVPVSDRADIELISIDETLSGQANPVGLCTAPTSATSLAYVTFTSGSTGKPKGVMVEHRGVVRLVKESNMMQHLPPKPVMAHVTNTAFDVAGFEIYGALLNGGTLVCIDSVMVLDFRIVSDIFKKEVIDAAIFAPALLKQYLAECPAALQNLKAIYVAGDRADVDDLFAARELIKGPVVNAYGPTENSVISTLYQLQDGERCVNGVPIGESISNSGAYVLDRNQRLVPLGVVGELVVTGDGIARGYTDPERNTGRFVEITIGTEKHRAYRTGDVVRRRPCDGQIEFFGRMDGQVKLRGHRVELGEIEHSLRTHEDVNEAVVVLHKEEGKEDQLNGFVTVRQAASQQQGPGEVDVEGHVDVWEQIFDSETYGGLDKLDANEIGRDFAGWISMYDGKDIDKEEMNEWLDETISTILNGDRPRNVLELGTGSGMVLFNLGDGLDSYIGLEPSIRAVHFTRRAANSLPDLAEKVHIFQGTAADIATLPCPVAPNLVIINSVAQYFPSQDYLQKVIDDCVGLKGVETIIFGDMRSHAMRKEFQASKAMFSLGDTATREEIQSKMAEVDRAEQELLVDPGFFSALVKRMPHLISHVEIVPKKMKATNELSCFRYAAVLHVKGSEPLNVHEVNGSEWIDFAKERLNRDLLLETLEASSHLPAVAISNIPYRKTIAERFVVKALEDGGDQVNWIVSARREAQQCPSMDACDLSELAESVGYKVELSWARQFTQRGGIDAIFHRHESPKGRNRTLFRFPTDDQDRPSHLMTSVPLRQQLNQRIQEELFERLKALLPPYMVPSVITILDNMPINDNGKVDRRALGERVKAQIKATRATVSEQPSTNTELSMQAIWAKVLNLEAATIGIHDKFFHLGGHSITAMKVVAEARRVGLEVAVADVLVHDTIHTLSLHCSTLEDDEEKEEVLSNVILVDEGARTRLLNGVKSLEVGVDVDLHEVEDILPLTSFQEKIILDGKKVGQHANYFHLDLGTNIDVPRLQESCARTMTRFSILRARFLHLEQHYWQVVLRNPDVPFHVIEVEGEEDMGQAFHSFCLKDLSQLRSTDLPLSFVLLKHKIQGLRLIIRLSHCQYDGISFPLIFQSLMESYRGFDLPPEPAFRRYLAYATLQRERSISYWKKILQGSSPTQIEPRILPPASWRTAPAKRIYRHAEMGLPSLPSKTTSAALVSAAWALLLSRITQQTDVVLGHVVAGRNASLSGLDETVGMCLNIIPIRAKLSSHQSSEDLLLGIQNQFAALGEADSLGFKDIIEHCTEWPAGSSFETVIQHQNIDERPTLEGSGGGEAQVSFFDNSHMVPPSLFIVSYPRAGKRLEIKLFANDHVITNKGADALLKSLCQVSERFGVSPQEPLESCMEAVDLDGLTHE